MKSCQILAFMILTNTAQLHYSLQKTTGHFKGVQILALLKQHAHHSAFSSGGIKYTCVLFSEIIEIPSCRTASFVTCNVQVVYGFMIRAKTVTDRTNTHQVL